MSVKILKVAKSSYIVYLLLCFWHQKTGVNHLPTASDVIFAYSCAAVNKISADIEQCTVHV